jgi:hypothetical protein
MDEHALPQAIRDRALGTPGGEHAWRMDDVEDVIAAAREARLACLGGQVQFRFDDGTCAAYWVNYDPADRKLGEAWNDYVDRSANETRDAFQRVCRETDFRQLACDWEFIRTKMDEGGCDPVNHLWFMLYFKASATIDA